MNEYRNRLLGLLGEEDYFAVLGTTPTLLVDVVGRIGEEKFSLPFAAGKWTAREVIAHLADVEQGTGFRVRQIVTSPPDHVIQPFDQDLWAKPYPRMPTRAAVRAFVALRGWNLAYYRTLSREDLDRSGLHPERGQESVETILRMQAGHDRNHLAQLEKVAAIVPEERNEYDDGEPI